MSELPKPRFTSGRHRPTHRRDNGYAFFIPRGRDLRHNRQTLHDLAARAANTVGKRQLTQQNGGLA
ncbi:hypothetical protein GAN17_21430 [Mycobacterium kubicae]|nr:hypothetical protein GAN17_21430 [Mycobacterium kubicae]QNI13616.1 hypothetical protein GAN18_22865 [Mycobacterium kubicae]